jgi:outer membrane protein W
MQLRFGIVWNLPSDDLTVGSQKTELDDAWGVEAAFEYLFRDSIGVEGALASTSHDIEITQPGFPDLDFGEVDLVLLTASPTFHFLPERTVDVYAGPTLGYAFWGDLEVATGLGPTDFATDDELVYGGVVGLDVPFGDSRWGFASAARLLFADLSPKGAPQDIGVDPIAIEVGVSCALGRRP